MTTVTFDRAVLTPAGDLEDALQVWLDAQDDEDARQGRVGQYAGGRRRLITSSAGTQTLQLQLFDVDRATLAELKARKGQLQLLRDTRGRVVHGTWFALVAVESPDPDVVTVTMAFQTTTDTVEV